MEIMSRHISVKEAAQILGKTERTIYRYIKEGKIMSRYIKGKKFREHRLEEADILRMSRLSIENVVTETFCHDNYVRTTEEIAKNKGVPIEIFQDLLKEHQGALVRLGQLEAIKEEHKMLTERAQSLLLKEAEYKAQLEEKEKKIHHLEEQLKRLTRKKWWEFWKKPISQLLSEPS